MRIHIATDHAGMELSAFLVEQLEIAGIEVIDHGPWKNAHSKNCVSM